MPNAPDPKVVSVRDIAARVGCSHASVSRALRGDTKVSEELRERIATAAKEMGYRPNPMIASLMATRNMRRHRSSLTANIGWLNTHPDKDFWHRYPYTRIYRETAQKRAKELNYGFEELWANEPRMTGQRLSEIAEARGIHGIIIPLPTSELLKSGFDYNKFSMVCLREYQGGQLDWNRISSAVRENAQIAVRKLVSLGYKRIGCAITTSTSHNKKLGEMVQAYNAGGPVDLALADRDGITAGLAGFLFMQSLLPGESRLNPCIVDRHRPDATELLAKYLTDTKADALICNDNLAPEAATLAGLEIPKDLALAHLHIGEDVHDWAGINSFPDRQASAAVDMLTALIERNERGIPHFPKKVHIEGAWVDGWTAPKL